MDQSEQFNEVEETPGYWNSVGIASLVFGFAYTILATWGGYMSISAEPSGSMFGGPQSLMSGFACLLAAFGGLVAIWHYNRETGVRMKLGRGALIGFYTGIGITLIATLLSQIWYMVDPTFIEELMNTTIANYEAMEGVSEDMRQNLIDSTYSQFQDMNTLWGMVKFFFLSGIMFGILNCLTGLLGVALFAREKDRI